MASTGECLVLASASQARAAMLAAAGLVFRVAPADIDEAAVRRDAQRAGRSALDCALLLAEMKALQVAGQHPGALVVGADQILVTEGCWFEKPADRDAARRQLQALRGRPHELATASCAVAGGAVCWQATAVPRLTMRAFSDEFLDAYLEAEGEAVLGSVGAYRIEGRGLQLFSGIDGDYFAILGLPLLDLLGFLRERGLLAA